MNQSRSALIVDDERDIRELLTLTLGRMGLRIDTAANVGEARELLARNTYDLCFTDMRLPDGNGIDLVGEIARNYPNTPVAMITVSARSAAPLASPISTRPSVWCSVSTSWASIRSTSYSRTWNSRSLASFGPSV